MNRTKHSARHSERSLSILLLVGFLGLMPWAPSHGIEPELGGSFETDTRWRPGGIDGYTRNETRLTLKLDARSPQVVFHAESRIRYFSLSEVQTSTDLNNSDLIQPWRHELYEAYADIYGLILENVDLRIGKQRIVWGTADELNVIDNLNPDDFEDILDFAQKIPTLALRLDYYPGDFTITAVGIPGFTPARSFPSSWDVPPTFPLPPELTLGTLGDVVALPDNRPRDASTFGIRIKKTLFEYDWSFSYVYGHDEWPIPTQVELIPVDTLGTTDVELTLEYPRQQIMGVDMAGAVGDIGVWAEGAVFFPEDEVFTDIISPAGDQDELALDDEAYVKFVIGGDYTFSNGLYVNTQYLHGFFTDRGTDNLEDYLMLAIEQSFLRDELKVRLAVAAEIADVHDIEGRSAYFGGPQVTYAPVDGLEMILGSMLLAGDTSTQFGQFNENDMVYCQVKYSF